MMSTILHTSIDLMNEVKDIFLERQRFIVSCMTVVTAFDYYRHSFPKQYHAMMWCIKLVGLQKEITFIKPGNSSFQKAVTPEEAENKN